MSLTHLHLLLNHFPTIGTIIGLGLFLVALLEKSEQLKRTALLVFLGIALLTIPTYVTGNSAQETLSRTPEVSKSLIETHEGAALVALTFMEFTGIFAWIGLWQYRRFSKVPGGTTAAVLILSLITVGLVSRAANIGGEIRHSEIRTAQTLPDGTKSYQEVTTVEGPLARKLGSFITQVPWIWAACETLHFLGLTILFGIVALVDLRMLGVVRKVPFRTLHRLMPWGVLAFAVNVATGMIFFVAAPEQYADNPVFSWKLALILLAGLNAMYFTLFDQAWAVGPEDDAPAAAKWVAGSAVVLWLGVIYCGSMLPFLGNAF